MKKYISFFRLHFGMGLQYRTAAWAGIATQFFWGAMEIIIYCTLYRTEPSAFPMTLAATVSYIWLQQAFLCFFASWFYDHEIFAAVSSGGIAYELCRPVEIYDLWFSKSIAMRASKAALRCLPILLVAFLLPQPYGLLLPENPLVFAQFLLSLGLAVLVVTAVGNLVYISAFYTISAQGISILASSAMEFLTGAIIPLPFLPEPLARICMLLPFASMQNAPLRIYSGDISGGAVYAQLGLQLFWFLALFGAGRAWCRHAVRRTVVQGG